MSRSTLQSARSIHRTFLQVPGGVEAEAKQAFKNLKAVIEAGGSETGKVVKTTVRALYSLLKMTRIDSIPRTWG